MAEKRGQSFLGGAAVLIAGTMLVKIIGAFFKIPLTNIVGGAGMGYFMTAYSFFNPIYALSVAGFPVAVSKLVSQANALGQRETADRIYRTALWLFPMIGLLLSLAIGFGAGGVLQLVGNPSAYLATVAIAPALLFACVSSVYRGYHEGTRNMRPTASSQVVEAVAKLVFGILLAVAAVRYGLGCFENGLLVYGAAAANEAEAMRAIAPVAAAGAVLGVTLSTAAGALYLALFHPVKRNNITAKNAPFPGEKLNHPALRLLSVALPVCLSALVINLTSMVDLVTVMNRLGKAIELDLPAVIASHPDAGLSAIGAGELPNFLYGSYTGLALTVFHLVPSVTASLGVSALPMISELWAKKRRGPLRCSAESVLKITAAVAIPAGLGMTVLAEPILSLLFCANQSEVLVAAPLLRILGIAAIFSAMTAPVNSMLQAVGRIYAPVKLMALGGIVKLLANVLTVAIPSVNVTGAAWGTLLCYLVILLGGLSVLLREIDANLNLVFLFAKPLAAAALCAGTAWAGYGFLFRATGSGLSVLPAVAAGALVYAVSLLLLRTITPDDLRLLKNGPKFEKYLAKKNLLG